jgi:hypothetical protein
MYSSKTTNVATVKFNFSLSTYSKKEGEPMQISVRKPALKSSQKKVVTVRAKVVALITATFLLSQGIAPCWT